MRELREYWQAVTGERCGAVHLRLLALGVGHDGPHRGHGPAEFLAAARPLVHTRQPAHPGHRHTRQQVLHNTHELPPVHRHRTNYAITIIDKRVSFMKCRKLYEVRVRGREVVGSRAHALWPRYHGGLRAIS